MNKKMTKLLLTSGTALVLAACSSSQGVNSDADRLLKEQVETSLTKSINDISKALNELQTINRGTKPLTDKTTAIGNTVAARPVTATVAKTATDVKTTVGSVAQSVKTEVKATAAPVVVEKLKVDSKKVDPKSSKGKEAILSTLDQKINLNWNGEAKDLLSSLSRKMGFSFAEEGTKISIPVKISAKNKTIKEVFGMIDAQTSSKADIKLSTINKTVNFVYK